MCQLLAYVGDLAETDANSPTLVTGRTCALHREAILAGVDVYGQYRDAQVLGLLQYHVRREVAGRLSGEESSEVVSGIVDLEPGGLVDGPGKLGSVALTEAVADEVGDSLKDPFGVGAGFTLSQGAR